jgi:hypothetical protein
MRAARRELYSVAPSALAPKTRRTHPKMVRRPLTLHRARILPGVTRIPGERATLRNRRHRRSLQLTHAEASVSVRRVRTRNPARAHSRRNRRSPAQNDRTADSVAARDKKRENVMILSRLLKTTVAPLTWVGLDNVRGLNRLHCWQFVLSRSANPDERLRIVLGE